MSYFQASIVQFKVTNDMSDVLEQWSVTKSSLDDKVISHQEKQTTSEKPIKNVCINDYPKVVNIGPLKNCNDKN